MIPAAFAHVNKGNSTSILGWDSGKWEAVLEEIYSKQTLRWLVASNLFTWEYEHLETVVMWYWNERETTVFQLHDAEVIPVSSSMQYYVHNKPTLRSARWRRVSTTLPKKHPLTCFTCQVHYKIQSTAFRNEVSMHTSIKTRLRHQQCLLHEQPRGFCLM